MTCYLSTSCFGGTSVSSAIKLCQECGVESIEFSAPHPYQPIEQLKKTLINFHKQGCAFTLHNYFPTPKDDFILNLASNNEVERRKSKLLVKNALELSALIGAPLYGVHPGYLAHANTVEDGKFVFTNETMTYSQALENAVSFIGELESQFEKRKVKLLIENLFPEPNKNNSLCCTFEEIFEFMSQISDNVGLLLDLGHWNVSSTIYGFDRKLSLEKYLNEFADRVFEVHLSENDGIKDQHLAVKKDSWQLEAIKLVNQTKPINNIERVYCIEARNASAFELKNSIKLVDEIIA